MSLSTLTYALSKKYTDKTVVGLGGLKGANCIIKSIEYLNGVHTVTFEWTGNDGTVETDMIEVENGTPIYVWTVGNMYEVRDLVIYQSCFYMCLVANSDDYWDPDKWEPLGSADGMFGMVASAAELPEYAELDRKLFFVIEENAFYLWNGEEWDKRPVGIIDYNEFINTPIINLTSTSDSYNVLSIQPNGMYSVLGNYKIFNADEIRQTDSRLLCSVQHNKNEVYIKLLGSTYAKDYCVLEDTLLENEYLTSASVASDKEVLDILQ